MLYSGQLDIIVAAPLTEAMLQTVPWKYLPEYKTTKKLVWKVSPSDTEVAGYVRVTKQFYQVQILLYYKYMWKVSPSDTEVAGYVRVTKQFYQVQILLYYKYMWKVSPSNTEVAEYVRLTKQFYQVQILLYYKYMSLS